MGAKRILMIVGDFVEDYEVRVPFQALRMIGHTVDAVCTVQVFSSSTSNPLLSGMPVPWVSPPISWLVFGP